MVLRLRRAKRLTVLAIVASLVCAAGAYAAVAGLPAGVQVNNDLPAIDPAQDAGLTGLTAGTVTAGNLVAVPLVRAVRTRTSGAQRLTCWASMWGACARISAAAPRTSARGPSVPVAT